MRTISYVAYIRGVLIKRHELVLYWMQLHIKATLEDFPFRYLIVKNTDKNVIIKYILRLYFF